MTVWKCKDMVDNIEIFWNRTGNVELKLALAGLADSLGNILIVSSYLNDLNIFF